MTLDATSILGAGQTADGTVYVVRQVDTQQQLFVSVADGLVQHVGDATGEVNEGATQILLFEYEQEGSPVSVQLKRGGSDLRMSVLHGQKAEKVWDIDTEGEELTLIDGRTASELQATSTQTYSLDYAATQLNGDAVVIVAPDHAGSYAGYRLFWGAPAALSERRILSFIRSHSLNGATNVTFAVDTGSAVLRYSFPYPLSAGAMSTGALTVGAEGASLSGAAPPVLPDGAQFLCR